MRIGLQLLFPTQSKWRILTDATADGYPGGEKILLTDIHGDPIPSVSTLVTLFACAGFAPADRVFLTVEGGPALITGKVRI